MKKKCESPWKLDIEVRVPDLGIEVQLYSVKLVAFATLCYVSGTKMATNKVGILQVPDHTAFRKNWLSNECSRPNFLFRRCLSPPLRSHSGKWQAPLLSFFILSLVVVVVDVVVLVSATGRLRTVGLERRQALFQAHKSCN